MAERVYLHIGAPKCGTTFLQTVLWANRKRLAANGVLLPARRLFDFNMATLAVRADSREGKDSKAPLAVWKRMLAETHDWPGTVVISNEWFVLASKEQAERALEALAPDEVHLVYTARDLTKQVPAAWQESLKVGRSHSLGEFVAALDSNDDRWSWRSLDPVRVLTRWSGSLPASRVHVVTVPPPGSDPDLLWKRFAGLCGIDAAAYDLGVGRTNESLGAESARLLQRIGPSLREAVDADTARWSDTYRWLRRYVSHELLVPLGGSRIALGPVEWEALNRRSTDAAQALGVAGYDIVGDVAELLPGDPEPTARRPEEVTADEMLEVAEPLIAALLRRARQESARAYAAEQRVADAVVTEPGAIVLDSAGTPSPSSSSGRAAMRPVQALRGKLRLGRQGE